MRLFLSKLDTKCIIIAEVLLVLGLLQIGAIATLAPSGRGSRSVSRATPFAWAMVASLIYNTISAAVVALGHAKAMSPWLSAWLPSSLACSLLLAILTILLYSEHKQHLNLSMQSRNLRMNTIS